MCSSLLLQSSSLTFSFLPHQFYFLEPVLLPIQNIPGLPNNTRARTRTHTKLSFNMIYCHTAHHSFFFILIINTESLTFLNVWSLRMTSLQIAYCMVLNPLHHELKNSESLIVIIYHSECMTTWNSYGLFADSWCSAIYTVVPTLLRTSVTGSLDFLFTILKYFL